MKKTKAIIPTLLNDFIKWDSGIAERKDPMKRGIKKDRKDKECHPFTYSSAGSLKAKLKYHLGSSNQGAGGAF